VPRALRVLRSTVVAASPAPTLACAAAALSGFAALVYEVAWTRLLALVIGPTTYRFATMAAAFIGGLAIGSSLGTRRRAALGRAGCLARRDADDLGGLGSGVGLHRRDRDPLVVAAQVTDPNVVFTRLVLRQAIGVGLLLLPMTLALGATFPLRARRRVGRAVHGRRRRRSRLRGEHDGRDRRALAAGFALVPWLGLEATFRAAAILGALGGAGSVLQVRCAVVSRKPQVVSPRVPSPRVPSPESPVPQSPVP